MLDLGNTGMNPARMEAIKRFLTGSGMRLDENFNKTMTFNPEAQGDPGQVQDMRGPEIAPQVTFDEMGGPYYSDDPGIQFDVGPGWENQDWVADTMPQQWPGPPEGYEPNGGQGGYFGFMNQGEGQGGPDLSQIIEMFAGQEPEGPGFTVENEEPQEPFIQAILRRLMSLGGQ